MLTCSVLLFFCCSGPPRDLHSFPTRRSSDLLVGAGVIACAWITAAIIGLIAPRQLGGAAAWSLVVAAQLPWRSEEHTSELQSRFDLVCRLLLEKKKQRHTDDKHIDMITTDSS